MINYSTVYTSRLIDKRIGWSTTLDVYAGSFITKMKWMINYSCRLCWQIDQQKEMEDQVLQPFILVGWSTKGYDDQLLEPFMLVGWKPRGIGWSTTSAAYADRLIDKNSDDQLLHPFMPVGWSLRDWIRYSTRINLKTLKGSSTEETYCRVSLGKIHWGLIGTT